ncbi:pseudouridine synthase [Rathayibacter sp. PhB179]|nr:pseudouridine synthase [Rathayibacter sp. PhB192]TCM29656.1 pseudouridine synthase [Rathayibacter sp. PhB179]
MSAADLPEGERLQKVLAAAGVASRRVVEEMIVARRIRVNGEVASELGRRIDPENDRIEVDGVAVQLDTSRRYVMLNKPVGVVSSLSDENGRPDLRTYTQNFEERLFNVGRLDSETSGLLVLTNDGELAHVLAHPSFGVTKTYIAKVHGQVLPQTIAALTAGVELEDGTVAADKARLLGRPEGRSNASLVEITLHSGRNRVVRRMMAAVGHPVLELVRRQFGPLHLGSLRSGDLRDLTRDELGALLTISRQGGEAPVEKPEPTRQASAGARRPRPQTADDRGTEGRGERRTEERSVRRSEERPVRRSEERPERRSEDRPVRRSNERPERRSDDRPVRRSEERPERRADDRGDRRSDERRRDERPRERPSDALRADDRATPPQDRRRPSANGAERPDSGVRRSGQDKRRRPDR